MGYQLRGDRCEGRYSVQEVSSSILSLVSLTESFEDYAFNSNNELILEWNVPKAQQVKIQANGLQPQLLYRMDTVRPKGDTTYRWPIDVLKELEISRSEIGVVGRATYTIKGERRDIYVPLRIWQQTKPERTRAYQIVLWPGQEFTEVYISLAPMTADGNYGTFIMEGKPLGYNFYPAKRGIAFPISKPEKAGIYYLRISNEQHRRTLPCYDVRYGRSIAPRIVKQENRGAK